MLAVVPFQDSRFRLRAKVRVNYDSRERWRNDLEFRTLYTMMSTAENRVQLSNKTALIPVNTKSKISHVVRSGGLSKIQMLGSLNE